MLECSKKLQEFRRGGLKMLSFLESRRSDGEKEIGPSASFREEQAVTCPGSTVTKAGQQACEVFAHELPPSGKDCDGLLSPETAWAAS